MKRTFPALLGALLLGLLAATPASGAVSNQPGGSAPGYFAGSTRSLVPPCVTTTWRSQHWGMDKTRVGDLCYKADRSTWIPAAWPRVATVIVRGERRPVYLRTV